MKLEQIAELLPYANQTVHPARFDEWRNSPITLAMFAEITETLLDDLDYTLPTSSTDDALIVGYLRDGAKEMLSSMLEWKPRNLAEDSDED